MKRLLYATAALVLGEEGPQWLDRHPDIASMTITNHETVIVSSSFDAYRVPEADAEPLDAPS